MISECPINHVPFICENYSKCIVATKLCNGVNDCGDNMDENTNMCKHCIYKNILFCFFVAIYTTTLKQNLSNLKTKAALILVMEVN